MPWCPKCRLEYREGFTACSDCGADLVEKLEEEAKEINEEVDYDHEVYLTTASDRIEADVLESLLNSNQIPVLRKFRGAGGYLSLYMGNVTSGIDLFVPSKLLETAKGLIEAKIEVDSEELSDFAEEEKIQKQRRSFRAWIILLFFIPGLFVAALFAMKIIWDIFFG